MQKFHFRDFAPIGLTLPRIDNQPYPWNCFKILVVREPRKTCSPRFISSQKSAFQFVKKNRSDLTSET